MAKFKIGDKVRRTGPSYEETKFGNIYTVFGVPGPTTIQLEECAHGIRYDTAGFALVTMVPESALALSWDYAEAQRLQDIAKLAVKEYNDYVDRKPETVFLKLADY